MLPDYPFAGDYKNPRRSSPWSLDPLAETQTDRVLNPEWRTTSQTFFIRIGPVTIEKEHNMRPLVIHHTRQGLHGGSGKF